MPPSWNFFPPTANIITHFQPHEKYFLCRFLSGKMGVASYCCLTGVILGFILRYYEDYKQIFCKANGGNICHVAAYPGRGCVDDADYDNDEVFIDLWC